MNRQPSTTIRPTNTATKGAMPAVNPTAWRALFADARAAFGAEIEGLTCATPERAFFQKHGDPTFYSIALSSSDRTLFTF